MTPVLQKPSGRGDQGHRHVGPHGWAVPLQVEVAAIPEGGWEVSLRAGSGPAWLWWSVAVVVAVLLLLLVCFLLFLAAAWVFRHG